MKRSFASLFAIVLVPAFALVGCGDSDTPTQLDTTPPLAPVVTGAQSNDHGLGIWWRSNTEPDLAGYHVYMVDNGMPELVLTLPAHTTQATVIPEGPTAVQLYVTALDWTGNESSPSEAKVLQLTRDQQERRDIGDYQQQKPELW